MLMVAPSGGDVGGDCQGFWRHVLLLVTVTLARPPVAPRQPFPAPRNATPRAAALRSPGVATGSCPHSPQSANSIHPSDRAPHTRRPPSPISPAPAIPRRVPVGQRRP